MRKRNAYLILVAVAAVIFICFAFPKGATPKEGDTVVLTLVGKFENGTLVDNQTDSFELIKNESELPLGIFNEILSMHIGESRDIILTPETGFGRYDFTLLQNVRRINAVDRFQNLSINDYYFLTNEKPEPNKTVALKEIPWPVRITNMTNATIFIEHRPVFDSIYYDPLSTQWPIKIVGIDPDVIFYRYEAKEGVTILFKGQWARVKQVTMDDIMIDLNHPLAGKNLYYNVKLLNFTSAI